MSAVTSCYSVYLCQMLRGKQIVFLTVGFAIFINILPTFLYSKGSNYQMGEKTMETLSQRESAMHPIFEVVVCSVLLQAIRSNHFQGHLMLL